MAVKPSMTPPAKTTRFNPTAMAIGGSLVISIILATLLTGNPFSAIGRAYATLDGQAERPVPTEASPNDGNNPK